MACNRRGVTLIELLLVLALLGIILIMAYPRLDPLLSQQALKRDARHMAWILRSAKQTAITTGKPQTISFLPHSDLYKYTNNDEVVRLSSGIHYRGITFQKLESGWYCSFKTDGTPSYSGTVILGDENNHKLYIIVSAVAGRIRISDQPPWEGETKP